ncbi:MAG: cytochrome c biogenesis protein CcsA [Ignavibacteria bacterium]|nr:cytochrome c biogenesis protein CcsA [Ignavibacteria bacterium]
MIGSILLTLAFFFSIFSMISYFLGFRGKVSFINYGRLAYHGMSMLVILASTYLLFLILTHQYQYHYVYNYSGSNLSIGFLISTFWAGQEGSFMLWLLLTCIVGIVLQAYTSKRGELEYSVMAVFTLATSFLLAMVSPLLKNPFAYIWSEPAFIDIKNINQALINNPIVQSFLFNDPNTGQNFFQLSPESNAKLQAAGIAIQQLIVKGKGLNPLLQNFWMQIHPPILFSGFAMATVPFSFAISALMRNDYKDMVKQSFPWVLAGAGVLGLGIMLGGYWAYGVLGWGGYWAWDPVENSSLVPWLISVAVVHTFLVQRKSQRQGEEVGRYAKTNLIFSILIYVLVVYSTFLTRSGILGDSSVHSFVDPGMYAYVFLLVFILFFTFLSIGMIVYRWKSLDALIMKDEGLVSRELILFTSSILFATSALIVLVGTSAPLFKTSVEPFFYNRMHVPLGIIMGILNGFSLAIVWKNSTLGEVWQKSKLALLLSGGISILVIVLGGVHNVMMILLAFSALFTIVINTEIALKIVRGNKTMLGSYISHIGIALFILGVIGSSAYSIEQNVELVKGQPTSVLGYSMKFVGYTPIDNNTKYAFIVDITRDNNTVQAKPIMYISEYNNGLSREPDIVSGLFKDIYISPQGYDEGTAKTSSSNQLTLDVGEKKNLNDVLVEYKNFISPDMKAMSSGGDFRMGANIAITKNGTTVTKEVVIQSSQSNMTIPPVTFEKTNVQVTLIKVDPGSKQLVLDVNPDITVTQPKENRETLTVVASIKPFVNFVWIGVAIMVIGFAFSTLRRLKESIA